MYKNVKMIQQHINKYCKIWCYRECQTFNNIQLTLSKHINTAFKKTILKIYSTTFQTCCQNI